MNFNHKDDTKSIKIDSNNGYNHLNIWKSAKINIGVIGDSTGELKQMLMNKLTSYGTVSSSHDLKFNIYHHRNNSKLQIWDLSPNADINSLNFFNFISSFDINSFDLFILFRTNNFSQFDQKISEYFEAEGKKMFLVGIKQNFQLNISPQIAQKVYIISVDDFSRLNEDIIDNLQSDKVAAFILSIDPLSPEIIEKKSEILKKRSSSVSVQSSLFGTLISGPGLTIIADVALLSAEIWFYRKQLGLTKEKLNNLSQDSRLACKKIVQDLLSNKYGSYALLKDVNQISYALIKMIPSILASDVFDLIKLVPMVGTVLHGSASIAASKSTLVQIIDELSNIAIRIQNLTQNK